MTEKCLPDQNVVEKTLLIKPVIWLWNILPVSNGLEHILIIQKVDFAKLHHCSTPSTSFMVGVLFCHHQRTMPVLPLLNNPLCSINEASTGRPWGWKIKIWNKNYGLPWPNRFGSRFSKFRIISELSAYPTATSNWEITPLCVVFFSPLCVKYL